MGGFIIKHGVGDLRSKNEVDVPLSYGDYYYIEALLRLKKLISKPTGLNERQVWIKQMTRIASPVLENLAAGTLK